MRAEPLMLPDAPLPLIEPDVDPLALPAAPEVLPVLPDVEPAEPVAPYEPVVPEALAPAAPVSIVPVTSIWWFTCLLRSTLVEPGVNQYVVPALALIPVWVLLDEPGVPDGLVLDPGELVPPLIVPLDDVLPLALRSAPEAGRALVKM
jgi:hypothetical protein